MDRKGKYDAHKVLGMLKMLTPGKEEAELALRLGWDRVLLSTLRFVQQTQDIPKDLIPTLYRLLACLDVENNRRGALFTWTDSQRMYALQMCSGLLARFIEDVPSFHMLHSVVYEVCALDADALAKRLAAVLAETEMQEPCAPHMRLINAGNPLHTSVLRHYQAVLELVKLAAGEWGPEEFNLEEARVQAMQVIVRVLCELPREHLNLAPEFAQVMHQLLQQEVQVEDPHLASLLERVAQVPMMLASDELFEVMCVCAPIVVEPLQEAARENFAALALAAVQAEHADTTARVCALRLACVACASPDIQQALRPRLADVLQRIQAQSQDQMVQELLERLLK